jgi:hypothetical protein
LKKKKIMESSRDELRGTILKWDMAQSSASRKGCSGNSAKDKATWILADAEAGTSRDISLRIKWSFVERRYSPSTGMDRSKWEIILEQLLITGLIVKEEVVSKNKD